jgi:EAL domain-containing protein (putative c-di-GMP-specific phosphodiesterase class I)
MYEAKRSGRARAVAFNEVMRTRLNRKVAIESSLHKAIGTDQFKLVFQLIIDLDSGGLDSVEALVRWDHPELGAISPSEFIPIAEESELIATLGRWVLEEASRAFVKWHQLDPGRASSRLSVNVSRSELARGGRLLKQIFDTLTRAGMDPECLQLEVTERDVMSNPEVSLELMRELRLQGVRLAMDGFGTGTSSLRILREYPFNTIKIDRSFVKDVDTNPDLLAVIHATVTLIENLGMASLAEGVDDAQQLAVLQSLGCRYAQGSLFGSPLQAELLMDECWRPGDDIPSQTAAEDGLARQGSMSLNPR